MAAVGRAALRGRNALSPTPPRSDREKTVLDESESVSG